MNPLEAGWIAWNLERAGLNVSLSHEQEERLTLFFKIRAQWSKTHNLSGPQALLRLGTDLADAVAAWLSIDPSTPLVDVGSGSGVPGLLIGCLNPDQTIHLVEPAAKRCAFLRTALYQIQCSKVSVHRMRWPYNPRKDRSCVQVISRAVVSPQIWPPLADQPFVSSIIQMLALERPQWPLDQWQLVTETHYVDPEGGERLIRRWSRQ